MMGSQTNRPAKERLMSPFSDRLFIRLGDFEGAAEGLYAIGALTFTIALVVVIAAVVYFRSA
jgi:hypothetical protein